MGIPRVTSTWKWQTEAEARAFLMGVEHDDTRQAEIPSGAPTHVIVQYDSWADYDTALVWEDGKCVSVVNG